MRKRLLPSVQGSGSDQGAYRSNSRTPADLETFPSFLDFATSRHPHLSEASHIGGFQLNVEPDARTNANRISVKRLSSQRCAPAWIFLRDQGAEVGCYSNRYVQHVDAEGRPVEKSFGISHWRSLADLERWAESHPTHLKIFGIFPKKVPELPNLRLYHEVSVLDSAAQRYEYINCHPGTGLLRPGT